MSEQLPLFTTPKPDSPAQSSAPPANTAAGQPPSAPAASPGAHGQTVTPTASLTAGIQAWREHLTRERTPENTVKAFIGDLLLAAQFLGAFKSLHQLGTRDLDQWLQWQRNTQKVSPKTYSRRITSLKSFFRWLHHTGALGTDPAAALIQQTVLSPLPEILAPAEVDAALAAADALRHQDKPDPRPYVLFRLLLDTGLKKGEVLKLVPNHVDLGDPAAPVLWVRYPDPRHRYKERKLALQPGWIPAYQQYLAQFAPTEKLFPWSPRRLEYLLHDLSDAACLTKRISFDMCRWTCAVRDTRAGMDETHLRQKLGLSKIQWREIGMKLTKLTGPAL